MSERFQVFVGQIYRVGIIRYVDVPAEISKALGKEQANLAVRGTVEGVPVRTTLVSRGNRCHRMAIHGDIRKKLRVDTGAVLEIAIDRDHESREPALPPALVVTLRQAPRAQAMFKSMTTALRRQIVRNITSVKSQEALERRVAKVVARLEQMGTLKSSKQSNANRSKKNK
jgi:hypothetical protein